MLPAFGHSAATASRRRSSQSGEYGHLMSVPARQGFQSPVLLADKKGSAAFPRRPGSLWAAAGKRQQRGRQRAGERRGVPIGRCRPAAAGSAQHPCTAQSEHRAGVVHAGAWQKHQAVQGPQGLGAGQPADVGLCAMSRYVSATRGTGIASARGAGALRNALQDWQRRPPPPCPRAQASPPRADRPCPGCASHWRLAVRRTAVCRLNSVWRRSDRSTFHMRGYQGSPALQTVAKSAGV
jgi:hypothetical protein